MALENFFCCKSRNGAIIFAVIFIFVDATALIALISERYRIHYYYPMYKTQLYWQFLIICIDLISSMLLVIGVIKRNHSMMLPWIVVNGINMIRFVFLGIGFGGLFIPLDDPISRGIHTLCSYLAIYIWWCMLSIYQKVVEYSKPSKSIV